MNILWYLGYCRFIAIATFKTVGDEAYEFIRDTCIEGAYYELMMSTKKSTVLAKEQKERRADADAQARKDAGLRKEIEDEFKKEGVDIEKEEDDI